MTRQRLVKMTYGDRNILVKALQSARGSIGLEVFEKLQALMNKTLAAPKRKLYLSDEEHQYATLSLNGMRNAYLAADRSCGGIDRLLIKLIRAKYRVYLNDIKCNNDLCPESLGFFSRRLRDFLFY